MKQIAFVASLCLLVISGCETADSNAAIGSSVSAEDVYCISYYHPNYVAQFPFPTARGDVPIEAFPVSITSAANLADELRMLFESSGHSPSLVTTGCRGLAILGTVEEIDFLGQRLQFLPEIKPDASSSIIEYLTDLFYSPPGYYRIVAILIFPKEEEIVFGGRMNEEMLAEAASWGWTAVPNYEYLAASESRIHVAVYEFRVDGQNDPEINPPVGLQPLETHLTNSVGVTVY